VSLKHLRLIFSAPSAGDSFSEEDRDFDGFPLPEPSGKKILVYMQNIYLLINNIVLIR